MSHVRAKSPRKLDELFPADELPSDRCEVVDESDESLASFWPAEVCRVSDEKARAALCCACLLVDPLVVGLEHRELGLAHRADDCISG